MVSLNNITVRFGGFTLFEEVSFHIGNKDRIGLVGKNGAGKSTLLKIITGEQSADEGTVSLPNEVCIGYLPQNMNCKNNHTVWQETELAYEEVKELEKTILKLTGEIAERDDYESENYINLLEKISHSNDRLEVLGSSNIDAEIEHTLTGLGFISKDFDKLTSELSGGWRMRIELAKILLKRPDLLLLDEPTNHLDIESIQWLEEFLSSFPGSVLLISHDRAFLDNITNRTIEISLGKIYDYKTSYSKYVELRKERFEQQLAAFNNQQKVIKDTERFIERFRYKNTKSVQVQSRIKMLNKLERIEVDQEDKASVHFRFPPAPRSGTDVIEIKELSKSYGTTEVLKNIDLIIQRNEKVAFVGKNGEGKTTLSRIIAGELDYKGEFKFGHNVKFGYYAQNQDELMDENKTVLQTIDEVAVGDIRTRIRDILGSFLFSGEDVDKKVKVLSGGERSRLALAKLLLEPVSLLILDEPTNHLDMLSKEILKNALIKYDGTLILVSHDRYFLDGLINKVYEFKNHKIHESIGGIYDFLRKRKIENLRDLDIKSQQKQTQYKMVSINKLDYESKKELEKQIRKLTNQVQRSEKQIEELESEIVAVNYKLENPDREVKEQLLDNTLYEKYENCKEELEKEMQNWEKLHIELEKLINKRI
ncbi:MAG: ribosomal protection-like ABC-F family protein [Bacteroidota bacterium]